MSRTRVVFFAIVGVAVLIVLIGLAMGGVFEQGPSALVPPTPPGPIEIRIVAASTIYPWVDDAARAFNSDEHLMEGQPIRVQVVPMDGLEALRRFDAQTMEVPTAWIPESRYLVELVNAVYKPQLGRDVFLTDGEYRARPIAISLLAWGVYQSRARVLEEAFGEINWQALHDAAVAQGGWPAIGGPADWGYFKLLIPSPNRNIAGLSAMISAAGEYFGRPDVSVSDVMDEDFQQWLYEIMSAVPEFSSAGAYPGESLALFGPSGGEVGQLLESDILMHMAGAAQRWGEPLLVYYPSFVTWFDYPFTIWIGSETTAAEKNAALEFERYLLSLEVQTQAVGYGLRPVHDQVGVDLPDSPFVAWEEYGVVTVVPRYTAMRSPSRDVLETFLTWFERNVAER